VGYVQSAVVEHSHANGAVFGRAAVGGLVGVLEDGTLKDASAPAAVRNSYADAAVTHRRAIGNRGDSVGGLVGEMRGSSAGGGASVEDSYAVMRLSHDSATAVGGLVGRNNGRVVDSYAVFEVASGTGAVGGLVGSSRGSSEAGADWLAGVVEAGYWDAEVSGVVSSAGGSAKTTVELRSPTDASGIYGSWDGSVWDFGTATQYPRLRSDFDGDGAVTACEFGGQGRCADPVAVPSAPLGFVAGPGNGAAVLSWVRLDDVSVTRWQYRVRPWGGVWEVWVDVAGSDAATVGHFVAGLTNGERYGVQVRAVNSVGAGAASAVATVTPSGVDERPTSFSVAAGGYVAAGDDIVLVFSERLRLPDGRPLTDADAHTVVSLELVGGDGADLAGPGRVTVDAGGTSLRIAPDPDLVSGDYVVTVPEGAVADDRGFVLSAGLSAIFTVAGTVDYDSDGDGLIEVRSLAQLDALRWDLDGDGVAAGVGAGRYRRAFPSPVPDMGCPSDGCEGYELVADLDFDTDGDGAAGAGDQFWNDGAGWAPVAGAVTWERARSGDGGFNAVFDGGGHSVSNLFIDDASTSFGIGLFGVLGPAAVVRDVNVVDVDVTGHQFVGALAGVSFGAVEDVSSSGEVTARSRIAGGLVGIVYGVLADGTPTPAGASVGHSRSSATVAARASSGLARPIAGGLVGYVQSAVLWPTGPRPAAFAPTGPRPAARRCGAAVPAPPWRPATCRRRRSGPRRSRGVWWAMCSRRWSSTATRTERSSAAPRWAASSGCSRTAPSRTRRLRRRCATATPTRPCPAGHSTSEVWSGRCAAPPRAAARRSRTATRP
jgi:hypothetical protein